MERIITSLDVNESDFIQRAERYKTILGEYYNNLAALIEKPENSRKKGKKTARERIDLLVDNNTSFLEFSVFADYNQHQNDFASGGIITGVGYINGREVIIVANEPGIKGGTYTASAIKKHLRAQEIAMKCSLPCIYLVDSGGIYLPEQSTVFADRDHFGRIFYNQAILSSLQVPQIAVVLGPCTAGGAYIPAMSDETIIVKDQGTIFLGGPPLVKAATGETVTAQELGGSDVHVSRSGVADHLAEDEEEAFRICRDIISTLPPPYRQPLNITESEEPLYPAEELYGILPVNSREHVNAYELLARIIDRSEIHEFKRNYGKTIVTGFCRIMGIPAGIIVSNGILFSESALKAVHFIELCNFRKTPIIFLQNITGFMVGKKYENEGIARDGAKMVHAVANCNVPKITLIIGNSFGAGNYAMAGRAFDPTMLFIYPNAKTAVMGGEQAAQVLSTVKKEQRARKGLPYLPEEQIKLEKSILENYAEESSAYYSSSRLWDDGIIDPKDTRRVLAIALSASLNHKFNEPRTGIFRM